MAETDAPVADPAGGPDAPKPGLWKRYGHVFEAWIVFSVCAGVMIQALIWSRPFTDTILPRWVAVYTSWVLALFGAEGRADGVLIHSTLGTVEIIRECTAVYPTVLFLAAVIAYRCSWRRKLAGLVGGILAIQVLNVIRIITLIYIMKIKPDIFEYMHMVVWQSLIVFFTVVLWVIWATEFSGARRRKAHAP